MKPSPFGHRQGDLDWVPPCFEGIEIDSREVMARAMVQERPAEGLARLVPPQIGGATGQALVTDGHRLQEQVCPRARMADLQSLTALRLGPEPTAPEPTSQTGPGIATRKSPSASVVAVAMAT